MAVFDSNVFDTGVFDAEAVAGTCVFDANVFDSDVFNVCVTVTCVFDGQVFDLGVFNVCAAAGDATAAGSLLTATVSLIPGVAQAEAPQIIIPATFGVGGRMRPPIRPRINARARGALLVVDATLLPGATFATVSAKVPGRVLDTEIELVPGQVSVNVETTSGELVRACTLTAGKASGFDAVKHDNDWFLLAA